MQANAPPYYSQHAVVRLSEHVFHSYCVVLGRQSETVNTDIVVLSVACFHRMSATELWVAFGSGKHLHYIAIHELVSAFGADRACALPFFTLSQVVTQFPVLQGVARKQLGKLGMPFLLSQTLLCSYQLSHMTWNLSCHCFRDLLFSATTEVSVKLV